MSVPPPTARTSRDALAWWLLTTIGTTEFVRDIQNMYLTGLLTASRLRRGVQHQYEQLIDKGGW